jgi:hypothetical protein
VLCVAFCCVGLGWFFKTRLLGEEWRREKTYEIELFLKARLLSEK